MLINVKNAEIKSAAYLQKKLRRGGEPLESKCDKQIDERLESKSEEARKLEESTDRAREKDL